MGVKVFLVEDYMEEVLMIKDEVGSVDGYATLDWRKNTAWKGSKV